ncbi:Zn-dependent oxidoreductase [Devosia limi DSM 17137]|uniref:NADPH:quinone reductase n=1 Tax=Devosia limi DSM 17137 TaxID=1121477 RepID=A0A0F5LWP3_9HYPH|nr:NAD(P)-dependent alcohol dehydrogenase [Devosia limi]KKB86795.1 Zn-dependent oxidoreductase [Devosia limi DSM 17137]SHF94322.1 NADPH:quinone reductase [Devosia limi DSM 17137]
MKAVIAPAYGGPEVLRVKEIDRPKVQDKQILVKVYASAVTQADVMMRTGTPWFGRIFLGLSKPKAAIPGTAFAGKVIGVGPGVTRFAVGDDVFGETGLGFHAHAQFLAVPEDGVIEYIPATMSYQEAAPVVDGTLTVHHFLTRLVTIRPDQKVLINGAAGGLGTSAVQLAKHLGAEVTAVASGRNSEFLSRLGADHVIDYEREDFSHRLGAYDVIFDTVGKVPFGKAKRALKPGGVYLSPVLGLGLLLQMLWTGKFGRRKAKFSATGLLPHAELGKRLTEVKTLIEAGALRTIIDRHFDLTEIGEAHRYVQAGHKRGNVVLEIVHDDLQVLAAE